MWSSSLSGSSAAFTDGSAALAEGSVATTVHATSAETVRQQVVPLSKPRARGLGPPSIEKRNALERKLNGTTAVLHTSDAAMLDAVWCQPTASDANGYAALVFHGNGMTLDAMGPWASFYKMHGFHVLLVTIRGYPGSSGDSAKDGELGMYLDAAAAVHFAGEKGFDNSHILAHGFSLGGSLAAAASCQHGLAALTLDHTFTSPKDVGVHVTRDTWLPSWLVAGALGGAYPPGTSVDLGHGVTVLTDGLNTLEKVRQYPGALFVFYGTSDALMPTAFATRFLEARYPSQPVYELQPAAHAELQGGHNNHMFFEDEAAMSVYLQHLQVRLFDTLTDADKLHTGDFLLAAPAALTQGGYGCAKAEKGRRRDKKKATSANSPPSVLGVSGFSMSEWGFNGDYEIDRTTDSSRWVWRRSSDSFYGILSIAPSWIEFSTRGYWVLKSDNGHRFKSGLTDATRPPVGDWESGISVVVSEQ